MADEPIKDPTKKSFWRARNFVMLAATGLAPLLGHAMWSWAADRIKDLDEVRYRLRELEANAASRNAIWGAIGDVRTKQTELDLRVTVMQQLFEREWGRGVGAMEKEYATRISKLEEEIKAYKVRTSVLTQRLKECNPGVPWDDVAPPTLSDVLKKPDPPKPVLPPPIPQPKNNADDPEKLRELYEQRFPRTRVQEQQQKK